MDTRIFLLFSLGIQHFPERIRMTNISKINWKATIQIQTEHFKLICTAFSVYVEKHPMNIYAWEEMILIEETIYFLFQYIHCKGNFKLLNFLTISV